MTTPDDLIESLCERLRDCCDLLEHQAAKYRPHLPRYDAEIKGRLEIERARAILTQAKIDGLPQDGTTYEHFFHPLRVGRT